MQKQNRIFRRASLDRLASPEQLDQVIQVTNARGWLALAAVGVLLLVAIVWGIAGSIADKVNGMGILVRSGGVLEVVASAPGRVVDVAVVPGDSILEGQVIARLTQPELYDRLERARERLDLLRSEHSERAAFATREAELQARNLQQQRENLQQSIASLEESLGWLAERVASQEQLLAQGLITRAALLSTQQQHEQTRERIRSSRSEVAQVELRRLAAIHAQQETVRTGEHQIDLATAELEQLEREFLVTTRITSPYTGRVLEIMTEPGKLVSRGEPVLSLDLTGQSIQDLVAVIYVPSLHGKMVKPGMGIQISPTTVRQEEYGFMLGTVTFVSNYPATARGMQRVLKNEQLVAELSGGGAPYEVHAALGVDPATVSRYRWSSSQGPAIQVESGTLATAAVTVSEQRPIGKVVPVLRRWTGI